RPAPHRTPAHGRPPLRRRRDCARPAYPQAPLSRQDRITAAGGDRAPRPLRRGARLEDRSPPPRQPPPRMVRLTALGRTAARCGHAPATPAARVSPWIHENSFSHLTASPRRKFRTPTTSDDPALCATQ